MSSKGYALESEIEDMFLAYTGQTKKDPVIVGPTINRTFRVPTSGAMACLNGDVRTQVPFLKKQFMVECKRRKEKSSLGKVYRLEWEWLRKNAEEADSDDMIPIHIVSFTHANKNRMWVVFRGSEFFEFEGSESFSSDSFVSYPLKKNVSKKSLTLVKSVLDKFLEEGRKVIILPYTLDLTFYMISLDLFKEMLQNIKNKKEEECSILE